MRDISLRSIYLALLSPIVGVADTSPEGGSEINCVIARERSDEVISREGGGLRSRCSVLFRWDISLPLNMTQDFLSALRASQ